MTERRELTEADRQRIHEEALELRRRVMNYEDEDQPKAPRVKKQKPKKEPVSLERYNHEDMRRMYVEEGLQTRAIAEKLGCHKDTVRKALQVMGVWSPESRIGGRPKQDFCNAGHDQSIHRITNGLTPNGTPNTSCGECRKKREREARRENARKRLKGVECYVLFEGAYEDRGIVGIFSSWQKARDYAPVGEWEQQRDTFWWRHDTSMRNVYEIELRLMDMPE